MNKYIYRQTKKLNMDKNKKWYVTMGAGLGMIIGFVVWNAGVGLVLGAAIGLTIFAINNRKN
ncbi:MAG: hypothetical protein KJO16_09030 [Muriicola sp.]|nr:hypothetical protein [Muriicola sp.]